MNGRGCRPFRAHFVFCICNPGLTPWAIRRLSALSAILYTDYIFVQFELYQTHKHQYIIFTNIIIVAKTRLKALHKSVKTDLIVNGVNPGETTTIITNTIIVAETRLKALHKSDQADLIAQGVNPGLTTTPPLPQKP